jgi:hypothetical protein
MTGEEGTRTMLEDEVIVASWPAARTVGPFSWEGSLLLGTEHLVFAPIELRRPSTGALSIAVAAASGSVEEIAESVIHTAFDRSADELVDRTKLSRSVVIPLFEIEAVTALQRAKPFFPGRMHITLRKGRFVEFLIAHRIAFAKFLPPRKNNEALEDCVAQINRALRTKA